MTGWSYKRRRSHDPKKHRRYLLNAWFSCEILKGVSVRLENAILYGDISTVKTTKEDDGTFSCTIAIPDVLLKQIMGAGHA